MTQIILASATSFEIAPLLVFLDPYKTSAANNFCVERLNIDVCVTGVGMVNTAFELGRLAGKTYDLAINAGVAGSFGKPAIGEVVNVVEDCLSELGAEDDADFLSIDAMGFGKQTVKILDPLKSKVIDKLPVVKGITVNTVHGNETNIAKLMGRCKADTESMEGAAFIHAVNAFGWKAIQLRAISNKVEKRNRNNWRMPLAIENLNKVLIELIRELSA